MGLNHVAGIIVQLTTSYTDFFVVAQMSVDLVEFVILVGIGCGLPRLKYVVQACFFTDFAAISYTIREYVLAYSLRQAAR